MSKPIIALQLYTVRDFAVKDPRDTLQKIKEMGYNDVELAGMYGLSAQEFRALLDEVGLRAVSAHVGYGDFKNDIDGTVDAYKTLGCKYVAIPWLDEHDLPGGENWAESKPLLQKIAAKLRESGIVPLYHNHDFEFKKLTNGEYILDAFFRELPEFDTEIDSGWVAAVDLCPATYIKQYAGRCPLIHLKDTIITDGNIVDHPVGSGSQDMPAITKAALESGAAGFVAELDETTGMTSLEAAKQSLEYLRGLV